MSFRNIGQNIFGEAVLHGAPVQWRRLSGQKRESLSASQIL